MNRNQAAGQVREGLRFSGSNPTRYLNGLTSVCMILIERGEYEEASEVADEITVVAASRKATHTALVSALKTAAGAHVRADHPDRAVVLREDILATEAQEHGEQAVETLVAKRDLAIDLSRADDLEQAIQLHREVLSAIQGMTAHTALEVGAEEFQLGLCLAKNGDYVEARRILESSVERFDRGTSDLADAWSWLAWTIFKSGETDEALGMSEHAVQLACDTFGIDDPRTLHRRGVSATILARLGRMDEAVAMLRAVLAGQERVLGDEHEDTQATRRVLDQLLG